MSRTHEDGALVKIVEAGLLGDRQRLELVVLGAIRSLKRENPVLSQELSALLSSYSSGPEALRWKGAPPPADSDEGLSLLRIERVEAPIRPILPQALIQQISQFVQERQESKTLLEEGVAPPRSILMTGAPGTGKTMLARWIAGSLSLPLVSLDLATSISSLLGKTGYNLRRTLDYARNNPCVFLLDEFDAIAKRRDDASEVGELKRIVNVLLKELENWPLTSVLIAATNHPDLLDPAIRRRFDVLFELPLPGDAERRSIVGAIGGRFVEQMAPEFIAACSDALVGASGSEIESLTNAAVRLHLVSRQPFSQCFVAELQRRCGNQMPHKVVSALARALHNSNNDLTVRELGSILGRSPSTVQYHLSKEEPAHG